MPEFGQSPFLQALGWATLNSFWQIGLLWCTYLAGNRIFTFRSAVRYQFAVAAVLGGFSWFLLTFILFYQSGSSKALVFLDQWNPGIDPFLPVLLTSASLTYLFLLVIPSYRFIRNWRFIRRLRTEGLSKPPVQTRLFIQKVSQHLGIKKKVQVYLSELVQSPLTVGYFKPLILLPLAALNNLTLPQAEAVLLHELSHIRRSDYGVNLLICTIHTLLYFNPFVKLFVRVAEMERENCCDELVLQFGYDKVSYASALLTLERASSPVQLLAIGATGKKPIIKRIEKIVGMEQKKSTLSVQHFAGFAALIICMLVFNSFLNTRKGNPSGHTVAFNHVADPFTLFNGDGIPPEARQRTNPHYITKEEFLANGNPEPELAPIPEEPLPLFDEEQPLEPITGYMQVAHKELNANLTAVEENRVAVAVNATKKVISDMQWQEVEKHLAESMTQEEKAVVHDDYLKEIEKINWQNLENNLKVGYEKVDWDKLNNYLGEALATVHLDSLQRSYTELLSKIRKAEAAAQCAEASLPFPDHSIEQIERKKDELRRSIERIRSQKEKKVIRL